MISAVLDRGREEVDLTAIEAGKTYKARGQGMNITPETIDVHVVWISDLDVHYRKGGDPTLHQTPIERFLDIVDGDAL